MVPKNKPQKGKKINRKCHKGRQGWQQPTIRIISSMRLLVCLKANDINNPRVGATNDPSDLINEATNVIGLFQSLSCLKAKEINNPRIGAANNSNYLVNEATNVVGLFQLLVCLKAKERNNPRVGLEQPTTPMTSSTRPLA
ncbi:hypothetical protein AMTR_s00053p00074150 [Amborella trichopoda]|uniref:Uncharacterized protein n=1 Tax=Amborella trichopoda TaxID=13333 RepID=W1P563_AMBTC|nr:hypothetical protein AMTR_s00053p00074150 [Amborella trichopoda]